MKKMIACLTIVSGLLVWSSCRKQDLPPENTTTADAGSKVVPDGPITDAACGTKYLDLVIDNSGLSYMFVTYNTPSNGPASTATINGSAGNAVIGFTSHPPGIQKMTGLAYDPVGAVAWGITGTGGNYPNSLIKIDLNDVNNVGVYPILSNCAIALDLSDLERNPLNGNLYAINRSAAAASNRIVTLTPGNPGVVNCLSATIPTAIQFRGLAVDCGGKIYAMRMSGANGRVYVIDPGTGGIIGGPFTYAGPIAPGAPAGNTEMGMHVDCDCTRNIVTGNFGGTSIILTDGLPSGLGGPTYSSAAVIKPTVDFARLN
jgi:hypothetical protein